MAVAMMAIFTLAGCSVTTLKNRSRVKPLQIDHFYTTGFSGELKVKYEQQKTSGRSNGHIVVKLITPPPRVDAFRTGERVCVAVHSSAGGRYKYNYQSGPLGTDLYGRQEYSYESGMTRLNGSGKGELRGTNIFFAALHVGGLGGWQATCTAYEKDRSFPIAFRKPDRMLIVNQLKPGRYKIVFRAEERHTKRTHKVETTFNVE